MKIINSTIAVMAIFAVISMITSCNFRETSVNYCEEKLHDEYVSNNRGERFEEIKEKYDDNMYVLFMNRKEDKPWYVNSTVNYLTSDINPDLRADVGGEE